MSLSNFIATGGKNSTRCIHLNWKFVIQNLHQFMRWGGYQSTTCTIQTRYLDNLVLGLSDSCQSHQSFIGLHPTLHFPTRGSHQHTVEFHVAGNYETLVDLTYSCVGFDNRKRLPKTGTDLWKTRHADPNLSVLVWQTGSERTARTARCSWSQVSAFQHCCSIPLASSLSQLLYSSPRPYPHPLSVLIRRLPLLPYAPDSLLPLPPFIPARPFWTLPVTLRVKHTFHFGSPSTAYTGPVIHCLPRVPSVRHPSSRPV